MINLNENELMMVHGADRCVCYSGLVWAYHHNVSDQPIPSQPIGEMLEKYSVGAVDRGNDNWHCFIHVTRELNDSAACKHLCCSNGVLNSQDWVFGVIDGGRC
jgi:hypothetical protein